MKRFFVAFLLVLLLCQNVSAYQPKTDANGETDPQTTTAEQQRPANEGAEPLQKQTDISAENITGDQSLALVERLTQRANKANWALLISFLATIFAGLSWFSGRGANKVALAALKSDRAWITFDQVAHMAIFQGDPVTINTAKVRVHWKNTGNTPALKLTCSIAIKVSDSVESACSLIDEIKTNELSTETHVGPNQEFFSEFIHIPRKDFLGVVGGSKVAVILCIVRYKDIRHPKEWRTSKVWQKISFTGNTIKTSDDGIFKNLVGKSVFIRSDEIT